MTWIAIGVGVASAGAGAIEANQVRQKQKGIISNAYKIAQQRMSLGQLDTRQQVSEASGARGLTGGGDVTTGSAAAPGQPGVLPPLGAAHTLGAQQTSDLAREQSLEQTSLKSESDASLSAVNQNADSAMVNAGAAGISSAFSVAGLKGLNVPPPAPSAAAAPPAVASLSGDASPYPGAFGGIDPVHPLGRGAWANPAAGGSTGAAKMAQTTSDFNVNG